MLAMMPDYTSQILDERYFQRCEKMIADWEEEAAQSSLSGIPRRSFYLEHMTKRARQLAPKYLGLANQRIKGNK